MRLASIVVKNVLRRRLRSALAAIGIMLAVGTTVALVSFSSGLRKSSLETYRGHGIDLVVLRAGVTERLTSNLDERVAQRLASLPEVSAVNPSLTDMVSFGEENLVGVPVHGWPADGFATKSLPIVSGRALTPSDSSSVMLGRALADGLKKRAGDSLKIEDAEFNLVGIYEGNNLFENSIAVVPLARLQALMDRQGQVTEFQIKLRPESADPTSIADLRQQIQKLKDADGRPLGLEAMPTEEYVTSSSEVELAQILANVSSLIALAIGSIGILNTMLMTVMERTQEIGALRALGWRRSRVMRLILGESLILSLAGGVTGIAVAAVLLRFLSQMPAVRGWIRPELDLTVAGIGVVLAVLMAVVGGLYPAYRATSCSAVEALRHE